MPHIRIYRHPDCARCARLARIHHALDLFGRVESTTQTPPTGALRMGQIVVEDRASGVVESGVGAFRLMTRAIPFYAPGRLLLAFSGFRSFVEREMGGCADGACEI